MGNWGSKRILDGPGPDGVPLERVSATVFFFFLSLVCFDLYGQSDLVGRISEDGSMCSMMRGNGSRLGESQLWSPSHKGETAQHFGFETEKAS